MSAVEHLDRKFRLAMKEGRADAKSKHDLLKLSDLQKKNIFMYMKSVGKPVSFQEIDVCFNSFRQNYWKTHRLPLRVKEMSE